jgi:hypothetical protein
MASTLAGYFVYDETGHVHIQMNEGSTAGAISRIKVKDDIQQA